MTSIFPPSAYSGDWLAKIRGNWHNRKGIASAEALAVEIDHLESHIDWYGSIVAKQPGVWGQARLMRHRQEFEKELAGKRNNFEATLQGSLSRSDQSFLTSAMSLSAAISGSRAVVLPPPASTSQEFIERRRAVLAASGVTNPTPDQLQPASGDLINLDNEAKKATDAVPEFTTTDLRALKTISFPTTNTGFQADNKIALEPTAFLDQLARYVNHLHEIRRINEGDDNADSPGYALHLVRIPVSILPGTKTRKGYGAEITVTASSVLGCDLLPITFRDLVINDLVEQASEPLADYFNSKSSLEGFIEFRRIIVEEAAADAEARQGANEALTPSSSSFMGLPPLPEESPSAARVNDSAFKRASLRQDPPPPSPPPTPTLQPPAQPTAPGANTMDSASSFRSRVDQRIRNSKLNSTNSGAELQQQPDDPQAAPSYGDVAGPSRLANRPGVTDYSSLVREAFKPIKVTQAPASRARNARFAFPPTQIAEVYGLELMTPVTLQAFDVLLRDRLANDPDQPVVVQHHLMANYVQDQATAAYNFMARPENLHLWQSFATPELAHAVQARDPQSLESMRKAFLDSLPNLGRDADQRYGDQYTTTAGFAWAILVESVMLNERLIQDIREAASSKGQAVPPALGEGLPFFLPNPPAEAREVFNEYIRIRFPIHVFALDPVNQEQNIADQLVRTRELQLALSLAFVTGNLSAANLTRYGRRLELQAQTIALNRTQIAFSHGDAMFGWRFQPRFQTPPTEGNFTVAFRDNLLGGPTREQDRRQTELEPGIRECVALVIMPSFVPYAKFETRTNWYRLNSPKHSEIDASKFLQLSKSIQRAYSLANYVCDAGLYRDGDIGLLVNRVKQLSAELPFQSLLAQVPYENTLGGFELFNVGTTDLAPELRSWYGAPGIDLAGGSNLYFVGDNFSVHQTSVIVGNQLITSDNVELLSRQVMRVTIPAGKVSTITRNNQRFVEASIATPYGTSQSLRIPATTNGEIPVIKPQPSPSPAAVWAPETLVLGFRFDLTGNLHPDAEPSSRNPIGGLVLAQANGKFPGDKADVHLSFGKGLPILTLRGVPFNPDKGGLEISGQNYDFLISGIYERAKTVFNDKKPPEALTVTPTSIVFIGNPVQVRPVNNVLTIEWRPKK